MPTITKFEQSAIRIAVGDQAIGIDIGSYVGPESLAALGHLDAVLVSHIHGDHFHEGNLLAFAAPVYTVAEVAQAVQDSSLFVESHQVGETVSLTGTSFEAEYLMSDHGPNLSAPVEQAAFLVRCEGVGIYFMADMFNPAPFPERGVDVVLIPVGNAGYTFSPEMAADHLRSVGWQGITVPIHYDNPRMDPQSGARLAELLGPGFDVRVLGRGESIAV